MYLHLYCVSYHDKRIKKIKKKKLISLYNPQGERDFSQMS